MTQSIAKILGWMFILIGLLGFLGFAGGTTAIHPASALLGLFPVNIVQNIGHILVGGWGVNAARLPGSSDSFCKSAGALCLALGVLGFVPAVAGALAGVVPLGGYDPFLHFLLGVILTGFGLAGEREHVAA